MKRLLVAIPVAAAVALATACGSGGDKGSVASLPTADISSFPTPSGSRATPTPEPEPTATVPADQPAQSTEVSEDDESTTLDAPDAPPITPEELQELRDRFQRGELSEEEAQEMFERLRSQFAGGQGGPGAGGFGPGGLGVTQAVGTIESVDGNTLTVTTELTVVTAELTENTVINITSVLEPSAVTPGIQVMVLSERVDGSNLASTITILPEGQDGFGRGAGGLGGGQAGPGGQGGLDLGAARPLVGSVTTADAGGFTLETQQGPLPISVDEETQIIETQLGAASNLEAGMRVTVVGQEDEEGVISALAVNVIPEGLDQEDVRGRLGGGRNPAGGGAGGQ